MQIKFKQQQFQQDAARAVCDVFEGQPNKSSTYLIDKGVNSDGLKDLDFGYEGFNNAQIVPSLTDIDILHNIQTIQRNYNLPVSEKLEGKYNITIEMETGVGKTYTYIKTMYELNKNYGWSKFIIVVPSVAIREGVYKSFQMTESHFAEEYGKKIRYFIYKSTNLTELNSFASDNNINVMIINSQAFNATGKDARRIYMKLDEFQSRRPIDVIAKTNPILIIDEPQSVEGEKTVERLKEFHALFTLRYSATHRKLYNMIYRLDAMDAYNQKLVKKIGVKGITFSGTTGTEGYIYLESVNLSNSKDPTATIEFDCKTKTGLKKVRRIVNEKYNIYDNSGEIQSYKDGYIISHIDGRDNSVEFLNGIKIMASQIKGLAGSENQLDEQLRRAQIRETIKSHIEKERALFHRGIKVLSLFFIDEVSKYRDYENKEDSRGLYAKIFEEEYKNIVSSFQPKFGDESYLNYLKRDNAEKVHAGYFSKDKKGNYVNGKVDKKTTASDDVDAYDLIMKDKERLLDFKEPVRFIFSHSALREGWDNPNVFQICTLKKQSESEVRSRQEIGRGLRLCINQNGERMDIQSIGEEVHDVNRLTVVTDWAFEPFVKAYQSGLAESIADRPIVVNEELFANKLIETETGEKKIISKEVARLIYFDLIKNDYVDDDGKLTESFYDDKKTDSFKIADKIKDYKNDIIKILNFVYNPSLLIPVNENSNNVKITLKPDMIQKKEFKELWNRINKKATYTVSFDSVEFVKQAVGAINAQLKISSVYMIVEQGQMDKIESKQSLTDGASFVKDSHSSLNIQLEANNSVSYDLIGKIVDNTGLTRKATVDILTGIYSTTFDMFKLNPEKFIIQVSNIINNEKASFVCADLKYRILDDVYGMDIFSSITLDGVLGQNALETQNHNVYSHVRYDSSTERDFAKELDTSTEVAVYVKLPSGFFITTPFGHYNPDWAIAFNNGIVKHIYFVAETKGKAAVQNLYDLRDTEKDKIECARKYFAALNTEDIKYDVVSDFATLLEKVKS